MRSESLKFPDTAILFLEVVQKSFLSMAIFFAMQDRQRFYQRFIFAYLALQMGMNFRSQIFF